MVEITVDHKGVLKLLNNLKIQKAPGPDGLSARVLRECSSEIAPILAFIYNETLAQGTLEHIIVSNINKHLAFESILADCQHGFRSQRSCETQLVQFFHDLVSNLDRALNRNHRQTDMVRIRIVDR